MIVECTLKDLDVKLANPKCSFSSSILWEVMRKRHSVGRWFSDTTNLVTMEAWMKNPAAFWHKISMSEEFGQSFVEPVTLVFYEIN